MKRWFFLLLLLTACSPVPKKGTMDSPMPQPSLQNTTEIALQNPQFILGNWPKSTWWDIFHSNELNSLINQALQNNPNILSIQEKVKVAQNEAIISRSKIFPLIFFDGKETLEYLSKNGLIHALNPNRSRHTDDINLSLSVNYEVDIWWKYHNLFYASMGREKAMEAEKAQVELVVSTAITQAYFALKTNLVRKELYEQLLDVKTKYLELQILLQEKALESMFTPTLALEELEETQKLVDAIQAEVQNNYHIINTLRGTGPDCEIAVDRLPISPPKEMEIPQTLSLDLIARRPDLAAALWRAHAQSFEVKAAIADFYPNINLKGLIGLSALSWSSLFQGGSVQPGVAPALHLPIFTAGAIRSGVRASTAQFNEAVQEYNALLLKSVQEVADLIVLLNAIYEKRISQNTILESADFRFDLAALNYEMGLDNMLNVYQKEMEWIEKALVDVELIYSQYLLSINLIRALGGGYTCD